MGRRLSTGIHRRLWVGVTGAALVLGMTTAPAAAAPAAEPAVAAAAAGSVLVFHGPAADQKDPVARATEVLREIGGQNGLTVDATSDPAAFTAANLGRYRGVVFLSANGVTLNRDQENALQAYIRAGGGFLGVANAAKAQADSAWFTGLIGTRPVGALRIPEPVSAVTASGENPPNETKEKLIDGQDGSKWLVFARTGWVAFQLPAAKAVNGYALTSANDAPGRNPKDWTLQGSQDGQTWTTLDTQTNQTFTDFFQTKRYDFTNTTAYQHYRLDITANAGDPIIQLAELKLFSGDATPPPEPGINQSVVNLVDRQHPANKGLPMNLTRFDRWINWDPNPVGTVHTVAQIEERHYNPGQGANGPFHPISWCRDYEGGRSFYTGMGGTEGSYREAAFRSHLTGALKWTAGLVRADCQATIASNYKVERLTAPNQAGQLDQIGEPHGLTAAPDGSVFYVARAACAGNVVPQPNDWTNPNIGLGCGTIHRWNPHTKQAKLLTTLPVMGNRGSGGELVKNEAGVMGIVPDPQFLLNGWLYVYWMPQAEVDRVTRIGKGVISRFTYDFANQTIDQATRTDILKWDIQMHSCCHHGGGMGFDNKGNLYVGVGDSNSSQGAGLGYSGNNWTLDWMGVSFQDARRTAGNTNDLNGKILRIHPEPDGTYTIPEGNLFPESQDPGNKTRPEIYVMGVRNISRMQVDPVNQWVTAAWVGPDAPRPDPELGPAKYETATIITSAGNQGWPYCMGNRQPYRNRSNTDATVLTDWYDCDNPKNTSPRNTGLVDLPPVRDNMMWYAPEGGGPVFPPRPDGSGIPTYNSADAKYTQPYWGTGSCQALMSGPTYHRSQVNVNSGVAWPAYWDNKWFLGDECNTQRRVAVTVDPATVGQGAPPLFAESLRAIIPGGPGDDFKLQSWMDAKFGPDGALYLLDYGGGFFTLHPNQKLIRVVYKGGAPTPAPTASSVGLHNRPLTVAFTGTKSGGVSYQWNFGDGTGSTEANPRHTYARVGVYSATLTVTYADGEKATTRTQVTVGCAVADPRQTVWLGDTNTGVANKTVGQGCTVNDLIDDEGVWPDHATFVRHVSDVTNPLVADGVLSTRDAGTLNRLASASPIGNPGIPGYESIFDGTTDSLKGWTQAPGGSFAIQPDGSLRSIGGLGMLWYSQKEWANFSVRLQFRDSSTDPFRANSGVFTRFPDPRIPLDQRPPGSCGTVGAARTSPAWVAIYCGQEVQIYDGATGEPQKTGSIYNFDPLGLDQAGATPKGTWSNYEVKVVGQHYTIIRNGVVINEFDNTPGKQSSRPGDPPTDLRQFLSGFIGLQNHGNNDLIDFRNIRVRPL